MKIKILKDGLYANNNRKAQECQAGEELETGNAYARSLIEDGFAEYIEQAELIEAPKKSKTTRAKKEKERDSPAESVNPFVG